MKKVLFLQIKGKSFGGVWNVNKLVGESLLEKGYLVHIVSIRNNQNNLVLEYNPKLVVKTINEKDIWESYHLKDIIRELKSLHLLKVVKMLFSKLKYQISLKKDIIALQKYIYEYDPDYIVTSHYQLLDMIPKEYLKCTIHEQHSSFLDAINHPATKKTLDKYKNKIKFLWLTKNTMDNAIKEGYTNSSYIYNAVKFKSSKRADVLNNKKLITIARLSKDKSLDIMIDIAEEIFKDSKFQDWILEIYGEGYEKTFLESKITNKNQIKLMGLTNNPQKELLSASINLNTSKYEGFSLSILEANECGIPTISFNFGESVEEQIIDDKTGIIANNIEDYINKLKKLMSDEKKLLKLSTNVKEYSNNFHIEKIIDKWLNLFNELDK